MVSRAATRIRIGLLTAVAMWACGAPPTSQRSAQAPRSSREAILASVARATARPPREPRQRIVDGVSYREVDITAGGAAVVVGRLGQTGRVEAMCVTDEGTARRFFSGEMGAER
jgi:hypothetical protein